MDDEALVVLCSGRTQYHPVLNIQDFKTRQLFSDANYILLKKLRISWRNDDLKMTDFACMSEGKWKKSDNYCLFELRKPCGELSCRIEKQL